MKNSDIALISAGVVLTATVGYMIYWDSKRRSDPTFRKQLRRERKLAQKASKKAEENKKETKLQLLERVIMECAREEFPTSPQGKEDYFMKAVSEGETLCAQGPDYYDSAILPFYKALKVYPAPQELLMIYQKTLPEEVFATIATILQTEQLAMQSQHQNTPEEAAAAATGVDIDA